MGVALTHQLWVWYKLTNLERGGEMGVVHRVYQDVVLRGSHVGACGSLVDLR